MNMRLNRYSSDDIVYPPIRYYNFFFKIMKAGIFSHPRSLGDQTTSRDRRLSAMDLQPSTASVLQPSVTQVQELRKCRSSSLTLFRIS